jgi:ribonuclease VapC
VIVDSSVLVAILFNEPEAAAYLQSLYPIPQPRISAASFFEASIVIDSRRRASLSSRLDELAQELRLTIEPVTEEQAHIARAAYRDYGRGSGHPARLNFGDCFAYALARVTGEPLLFKGDDFIHTDITPALREAR